MKRKKILLYNPKAVFYDMPLALLSIGSALDAKHYEVIIVDGRVSKNPLKELLEHASEALCFGVTALTGNPLRDALYITRSIKAAQPGLPVIWGGWHPSLFPKATLKEESSIDITVQGQGEITFRELVACLDAGADLQAVAGIAYRDTSGAIVQNPGRALEDMNFLPGVNYDLIEIEPYFRLKGQRQLDYISSAGCRFRCTFCADPFVFNRKWTAIQPDRMGEELAYWKKRFQFTDVNFQDETFFTKRKRVTQIASQLLEKGVKTTWAGTMRADQGARMTEEDFDICKKSGLRRVLVGVESGSQEMMDWLKKDIKLEQVYETARRCAQRDIAVIFPFIVGFPKESAASVKSTLQMAAELNAMHPKFTTPIFYFKPYPGSKITDEVVAAGYKLPKGIEEWADFDYIGSSGPWVDSEKYRLIENFKFYNKIAWRRKQWFLYPFQKIAQFRCNNDFFKFPLEKYLAEKILNRQELS